MPEGRAPEQGRNLEPAWFELTLVVDREVEAALSDALLECGAAAVQTEDADAHTPQERAIFAEPQLPPTGFEVWPRNRLCALLQMAPDLAQSEASRVMGEACALARLQVTPPWELRALAEQDWVRLTQSQFQPIAVGDRLWISPSWHDRCPADRTALILDPGLAFGTGSHPTTRLCLAWLESHLRGGEEVLDYGCGSGILGIAAALLGARGVYAVDIDPQALRATRENALRNGVADRVDVSTGMVRVIDPTARVGAADRMAAAGRTAHRPASAAGADAALPQHSAGSPESFDVVIANILAAPLKLLASLLEARLRPGGWIVLAGLLSEQAKDVSSCYPDTSPAPWRTEEGWTVLAGQRPPAPPTSPTFATFPAYPAHPTFATFATFPAYPAHATQPRPVDPPMTHDPHDPHNPHDPDNRHDPRDPRVNAPPAPELRHAGPQPAVLISGSIAFDYILLFDGHFREHILPEQIHRLNVAFLAPRLERQFGGCAANIAYNLAALGGRPRILATVGHDGGPYLERLDRLGIDTASVITVPDCFTAQAFITTDKDANQITAFHPGAMEEAHRVEVAQAAQGSQPCAWGIVAPNGKKAMQAHAAGLVQEGIPFIFDPGQGLPMFAGNELLELIAAAQALILNDYEASMLLQRTGLSELQLARRLEALVITRGASGCTLHWQGQRQDLGAARAAAEVDPTGCGDAFRAGVLHGLARGARWPEAVGLGTILGAVKVEHPGGQNHPIDRDDLRQRWRAHFNAPMPVAFFA